MIDHSATVRAYAHAISTLDVEAFVDCFASNCVIQDPVAAPPICGREGARAFFSGFLPLLATIRFEPGAIYPGGSQVAFSWRIEATGKNGRTAVAEGIDAWELDGDARILGSKGFWDPGPFVAALSA